MLLSEILKRHKDKYHVFHHMWKLKNVVDVKAERLLLLVGKKVDEQRSF